MKPLAFAVGLQAMFSGGNLQSSSAVALAISICAVICLLLLSILVLSFGGRVRRFLAQTLVSKLLAEHPGEGRATPLWHRAVRATVETALWLVNVCASLALFYFAASMTLDLFDLQDEGLVYLQGSLISLLGLVVFFRINRSFPGVYRRLENWRSPLTIRGHKLAEVETVADFLTFSSKALRVSFALVSFYVVGRYFTSLFPAGEAQASYEVVRGVMYAVLATVLLAVVVRAINRFGAAVAARSRDWAAELEASPEETTLYVKMVHLGHTGIQILRVMLLVLAVYGYAAFVLGLFAVTSTWVGSIVEMLVTPVRQVGDTVVGYLPNLFAIIVILAVTYAIVKAVRWTASEIGKGTVTLPGFYPEWAAPTYKIVRFLIIVFCAVVLFPYLPGSGSPAFQGISIFVGVLFSLGSSGAVSNIVSGVVLTYTRAFRVGDMVKISDTTGTVVEKTLLVTRVRTVKNVDITIPNSMVLGSHITNFSSSGNTLIVHTSVTIGYEVPWRVVHELLLEAANRSSSLLKNPPPFVHQTSLEDFYVEYELNAFTALPNTMAATYTELHQNIQDVFNERGVEIMSPHYRAVRDGNQVAIPAEHVPEDYEAPRLRVETTQPHKKA